MAVGQREETNVAKHRLGVGGAQRGVSYATEYDEISVPMIGAVKVARGRGQVLGAGRDDLLPCGRLKVKSINVGGVVLTGHVRFATKKVDLVTYDSGGRANGRFRDISRGIPGVRCEIAD